MCTKLEIKFLTVTSSFDLVNIGVLTSSGADGLCAI